MRVRYVVSVQMRVNAVGPMVIGVIGVGMGVHERRP